MRFGFRKIILIAIIAVAIVIAGAATAYLLPSPPDKDGSESKIEADETISTEKLIPTKNPDKPKNQDQTKDILPHPNEAIVIEPPTLEDIPVPEEAPAPDEAPPAETPDIDKNETKPEPVVPVEQDIPDILAPYYEKAPDGASFFDLPESTAQLVVVDDNDGTIRAFFFEKDKDNKWSEVHELETRAWGGSNGIRPKQREGDKVTPVGQFPIVEAFYINEEPKTKLEIFKITNDTYWVDDPDSVYYNQRIEGTQDKDWNSAEHMISYASSYKYGFVIGYNLDCTPGLGSAVFFHIAQRNTIGCVGVSETACLQFLAALDKDKTPYILIVSTKAAL